MTRWMAMQTVRMTHLPTAERVVPAAEMEALRALEATRTAAGTARAQTLARDGLLPMWLREASAVRQSAPSRLHGWAATAAMLGAASLALASSVLVKAAQARPRPFETGVVQAATGALAHGSSFPSTHTAVATAAAATLGRFAEPARAARLRDLAEEVAASRTYIGAHYPSDVAAGREIGERIATRLVGSVRRG